MKQPFSLSHIISIKDFNKQQIMTILELAKQFQQQPQTDLLQDKIIANCFFEPSTRTRLSFETAALKLGAKVIGFSDADSTSVKKGESLQDTIKIMATYADLIVIRHPHQGAARLAADVADVPVINAGDGANQHPTQALLDLFTMQQCQENLEHLNVALVGDLKYGRTIHSLVQACGLFNMRLFLVAPLNLALPDYLFDLLKVKGIKFSCHQHIEEVINKVDILYMTRIQQERFAKDEFPIISSNFTITLDSLKNAKPNLKILHPLPRIHEIDVAVDNTPHAFYFQQAANGLCIRQALLALLLGAI